jgi:pimeloyl-ACP methyl ester carboxylesterase
MGKSSYKSDFVNVNGIHLHYLDWGGNGETLLFLTGMGYSAHLFDQIAPRFTDKFRVLALTRRGQGESDYPETGYDLDILIDDIHDFMGLQKIEKVILAGHSFAGKELTYFTEKYPDKVLKLVYLDAVYDSKGRFEVYKNYPLKGVQPPEIKEEFESIEEYAAYVKYIYPHFAIIWNESLDKSITYDLYKTAQGKFIEKDTSSISKQMFDGAKWYDPQKANIKVPVLSFVAIANPIPPEFYTEEQKKLMFEFQREKWVPFQKKEINMFINDIPQAKVIEIPESHHYCFIAQEELVYSEMRKFLQTDND